MHFMANNFEVNFDQDVTEEHPQLHYQNLEVAVS